MIFFLMTACASDRYNYISAKDQQTETNNTYTSNEQQIRLTFPSHKWQLYTDQGTSPQVIGSIWKNPRYDGDSYNAAIAINPDGGVIIMHLKIIPSKNPIFKDRFENMMAHLGDAMKFKIQSTGGQVDNFSSKMIQRNNQEMAVAELTYYEQKAFTSLLVLLKEKDRLVLFEFYCLRDYFESYKNEFWWIVDSYERINKPVHDQTTNDLKVVEHSSLVNAESYVARGKAFAQHRNQYEQAFLAFNKAIDIDSEYAEAYISRGYLSQLNGQYDQAISDYSKAIEIQPQSAAAYINRGDSYIKIGQYDKAILDFNKAIEIKPHQAAYLNRGSAYDAKGQYDQAISDYSKAIAIIPEFAEAYANRGMAYAKSGRYEQGIADLNKAIELGLLSAYSGRGNVFQLSGRYDQAISDYSKALEITPQSADTYKNRGAAYLAKKQYDQAIADFNKAIEINPGFAESYLDRGNAYLYKGQYKQAISDYGKAIEIKQEFALAFNNRGNALAKSGQYDLAIADFNKAIMLNPASAFPYASLAWLLATCPDEKYRNGGKAIELAQKAVKISSHPYNLASLAAGYAEIGKFSEAITIQQELIALLRQDSKTENLDEFMEKLETYTAHKPWREKLK